MLRRLAILLIAASGLAVAACGESSDHPEHSPDLKEACLNMNQQQRSVNSFEGDLQAATNADPSLVDEAEENSKNLTDDLAFGTVASSATLSHDLEEAATAATHIDGDLRNGNLTAAQSDGDSLRAAMSQLGMDCSQYLT